MLASAIKLTPRAEAQIYIGQLAGGAFDGGQLTEGAKAEVAAFLRARRGAGDFADGEAVIFAFNRDCGTSEEEEVPGWDSALFVDCPAERVIEFFEHGVAGASRLEKISGEFPYMEVLAVRDLALQLNSRA